MMIEENLVFVRLFFTADEKNGENKVYEEIADFFSKIGMINVLAQGYDADREKCESSVKVTPYEYFSTADFDNLLKAMGHGWGFYGTNSAVWNQNENSEFFIDCVTWACVSLVEKSSIVEEEML